MFDKLSTLESKAARLKLWRESKKWWKWIAAAILGIGIAFALAALIRKLNGRSEELARLRTELETKEVQAAQKAHLAKVDPHRNRAEAYAREAQGLRDEAAMIKTQLQLEESRHSTALQQVQNIQDWAGLDKYNLTGR